MTNQRKALIALLLAAFLGGAIGVFVKIGVQVIPPITFIFLRFLIGSLILLPFISFQNISKKYLKKMIIVSLLLVANVVLFAFGVKETTAILGAFLYMFTPILVALFSYLIFKEKLSKRKTFGLSLGITGVVFLVALPILHQATQFSGTLMGNLLVFLAVISFALYSVLIKKYQQHYSASFITFVFAVLATLVLFPFAIVDLFTNPDWFSQVIPMTLIALGFVGIFGSAIHYTVYQYAIKYGSSLSASMMTFLQPVAGSIIAFLLLGERLTTNILLASLPIFVGVWLVTISKNKTKKNHARTS